VVDGGPQGVDVGARVHVTSLGDLLGGHISQGPQADPASQAVVLPAVLSMVTVSVVVSMALRMF
ncbi:MAG: hypothetical protein ABGY41_05385, partial [Candidatus Poribacteria bacterium]